MTTTASKATDGARDTADAEAMRPLLMLAFVPMMAVVEWAVV